MFVNYALLVPHHLGSTVVEYFLALRAPIDELPCRNKGLSK